MIRFRRNERHLPELNTSSLPDLIFTVLFFFIIVTHMRDDQLRVRYTVPEGKQLTKQTKKSSVVHIYIGKPLGGGAKSHEGQPVMVQVDDQLVPLSRIPDCIQQCRDRMQPDEQQLLTVSISADRHADMRTVMEVKSQLRRSGALNVMFVATSSAGDAETKGKAKPAPTMRTE